MSKKEIVCLVLIFMGIIIMTISCLDLLSIISSLLNKIFNLDLPDVWFNSFVFRGIVVLIGAMFLLVGALIYKKNASEEDY